MTAKARRVRAPKNLAEQYGEKTGRTPRSGKTEAASRRARRDAQARERLQKLMTPDEDLIRRLARAGAITSPASDDTDARRIAARSKKPRRARHWDWRCGKCGAKERFASAAALCGRCGAIAVRIE